MAGLRRSDLLRAAGAGAVALGTAPLLGRLAPAASAAPRRVYESRDGVLRATLTAAPGTARVGGQTVGGLRLYNGLYPGPVLRARPGDRLLLTVRNRLDIPTNTHFHGMHVSPLPHSDYVLLDQAPGTDYAYDVRIPANHPGGLFWYHPHRHMYTDPSVYSGLAGLLLIEGGAAALPELRGVRRRLFALQSTGTKVVDGQTVLDSDVASTQVTTTLNGELLPTVRMQPGETQLWQIGNASNQAYYRLAIPGLAFTVVEEDGTMRWVSEEVESAVLPPGKRFGILVTAPPRETELRLVTEGYYEGPFGAYRPATLATIAVAGPRVASRSVPRVLQARDDITDAEIARRRVITLSESFSDAKGPLFYVNGVTYGGIRPGDVFRPRLGTAEEWVIRNAPSTRAGGVREAHPFHVHVNDFQVVARGVWDPRTNTVVSRDRVVPAGTQDTISVRSQRYVVIRTRFQDFVGPTVFHCHILFHEDRGMMGRFDIVDEHGSDGMGGAGQGGHGAHGMHHA